MYQLSDFKKGLKVLVDGQPYAVVDFSMWSLEKETSLLEQNSETFWAAQI